MSACFALLFRLVRDTSKEEQAGKGTNSKSDIHCFDPIKREVKTNGTEKRGSGHRVNSAGKMRGAS